MKEMIIQIIAAQPKSMWARCNATRKDIDDNIRPVNEPIEYIGLTNLGRVIGLVAMDNGEFCPCDELCDFIEMDYISPFDRTVPSKRRRKNKKGEL